MKLTLRILLPLIVIGAGVWLWLYLNPPPEEAIRRRLAQLSKSASFESRESFLARSAAAQEVASFFAAEVSMNIEPRGLFPDQLQRAEIAQQVGFLRSNPEIHSFKLSILDPIITVGTDQKSAMVELTINVATEGERHMIVQEMKFTMRKVEDDWVICRLDTVRTLNARPMPAKFAALNSRP